MTQARRIGVAAAVAAAALLLPAAASAHAYLIKTVPAASVILNKAPTSVQLTFDEAVEPRFAIVSVTDVSAHQETTGPVTRSPSNPDTLVVPLEHVGEGWYLVYWRAISVDGHPVQGAFTFAVGPNAGPAPQFTVPHIAGTATSTPLVIMKWLAFLTMMAAIGLFVLRVADRAAARPPCRGNEPARTHDRFRCRSGARPDCDPRLPRGGERDRFAALLLGPRRARAAVAGDGVRARLRRRRALLRALRVSPPRSRSGVDRPERSHRPTAALLALSGALLAAAAALVLPGAVGHAGQTSPRSIAVPLDWLHLISGSIWVGGLIGLLVIWRSLPVAERIAGLVVCVPRFSNIAFVSVMVLLGSGVGASVLHLPVLAALWLTSYGKVILIKAGILLAAMPLASVNLLRTKPGLSRAEASEASARLLRRLVAGETVLVAGAIFAAALLASLAPPPPAFAEEGSALARVGPGKVAATVIRAGYRLQVLVAPNKAAGPNSFGLRLTRAGKPVRGANVTLSFAMLDMQMPKQEYQLDRNSTRHLHPQGSRTRDGRPLGALVHDHPQERAALHRTRRRPRSRLNAHTIKGEHAA